MTRHPDTSTPSTITASRLRRAIGEVQVLHASLRHEIGSTQFDNLMDEARDALTLAEAKLCAAYHEDNRVVA